MNSFLSSLPPTAWTIIGTIIGATIAACVALKGQAHQARQDALKVTQNLREKRSERIRSAYEIIVSAAWAMHTVAHTIDMVSYDERSKANNAELQRLLDEEIRKARGAQIRLTLDASAEDIRAIYDSTWRTFIGFRQAYEFWDNISMVHGDRESNSEKNSFWEKWHQKRDELDGLLLELETLARNQLGELDQVVLNPPAPPQLENVRRHWWRRWRQG